MAKEITGTLSRAARVIAAETSVHTANFEAELPGTLQIHTGVPGPEGPPGPAGADGTMSFEDLTPEQKESLRGPQGLQGEPLPVWNCTGNAAYTARSSPATN